MTGRTELAQKTLKQKAIFVLMSALYLSAGGYAIGAAFHRMDEIWNHLPELKDPTVEQLKFRWISGSFLIAMILMIKILNSIRRWNEVGDAPSDENIFSWSLTFGTQFKMLIFLLVLYGLAGAYM